VSARDADIYAGPDLANAIALSALRPEARGHAPRISLPRLRDFIDDALHAPVVKVAASTLSVTGTERDSRAPMRLLFRGQLRAVEFAARHILGTEDFASAPVSAKTTAPYDVAVFDHPLVDRNWLGARPCLRVPMWIRQRVGLGETWERTLDRLPHALKKEIARLLRKHAFTVTIADSTAAKLDFYTRVYVPFLKQRFGANANVRDERTFLREAQDALLMQLSLDGSMIGGTIVKRRGDALLADKTGLAPEHEVPGSSMVLDYFCFLVAQIFACKWLDFGISRPHVEDGVFRYKCKWRTELAAAHGLKPALRIRPISNSRATMGFLSRNGFIERRGERFVVRRLLTGRVPSSDEIAESDALAARSGLDALIVALSRPGNAEAIPRNVGRTRITALDASLAPAEAFLRTV
jgi:hypothetical protein